MATMPMVFGLTLTLPTLLFGSVYFAARMAATKGLVERK